jgi:MFS superfamily sulfate permease-like transporter
MNYWVRSICHLMECRGLIRVPRLLSSIAIPKHPSKGNSFSSSFFLVLISRKYLPDLGKDLHLKVKSLFVMIFSHRICRLIVSTWISIVSVRFSSWKMNVYLLLYYTPLSEMTSSLPDCSCSSIFSSRASGVLFSESILFCIE